MVTGIETAGLVLAIFPLVIEGMKVYASGARTIKDMKRHEMILAQYGRALSVELVKFENTCENLLADMVSMEDSTLQELMNNPGGPEWQNPNLEAAMLSRLRPRSAEQFRRVADELRQMLGDLVVYFNVDITEVGAFQALSILSP